MEVYKEYVRAVTGDNVCTDSCFLSYWRKHGPDTCVMKAMSTYVGFANRTALQDATKHIDQVRKGRVYYRSVLKEAATGLFTDPVTGLYSPPLSKPLAKLDVMAHYSFDYAQQVHFLSNPLQPGRTYFLTPHKCGIFGVYCEVIPQQVNYVVDDAYLTGTGANTVISMVHYYLKHCGVHSAIVHFNGDNYAVQNNDNAMIFGK
uniref:Uncharacterized protein n=1 Tax=Amphimedon queenslandica TaxID=400682 RepID=A0A1X7V6E1_AMPQE